MTKCTGLMGKIFGHKFVDGLTLKQFKKIFPDFPRGWLYIRNYNTPDAPKACICERCGVQVEIHE